MTDLANRINKFPIPFDHDTVQKQISQPIDYALQHQVDELDDGELGRPAVSVLTYSKRRDNLDNQSHKSSTSRVSGPELTPSKRQGRGAQSAKAWLLGWLIVAKMFRCHVTHHQPYCRPLIQLAHILVPNAEASNDSLLLLYEFMLGMAPRTLCIHSRLFLMPLLVNIHAALDDHLLLIIPSLALLDNIQVYLEKVHEARRKRNTEKKVGANNLWNELRKGNVDGLSHFKDGNLYSYHVVLCANNAPALNTFFPPYQTSGFYSHISPFAALLNAFRTLYVWKERHSKPASTLYSALQYSEVPEPQMIVDTMHAISITLMELRTRFISEGSQRQSPWKPRRGGGGSSEEDFKKYGFDFLDFGGNGDDDKGDAGDAGTGPASRSSPPAASDESREGDIIFLVPEESPGSLWSDDDCNEGIVTSDPGYHDLSTGLSPAQRIVNSWRRENIPVFTSSADPSSRTSSVLLSLAVPPLSRIITLNPHLLIGKQNRATRPHHRNSLEPKSRSLLRRVNLVNHGTPTLTLRIFGPPNPN
ncbi:hypothetical protein F5879DRAFT_986444 [Lentinula edodes]|uniref:uncharacterized protein n=1 Tax=Lentinula edodes TaxID=5353 RepID=UPI001E8E58E9|nr:uncharacterized protein C8R40DRAFT_1177115 [Lentinula edodes]KAH7869152.1 hypothetical protein C8R40DRAFT_1177115 [Lentinula edodes]KAJ3907455.1 hypothetical protein F5879DRAFT_986444 [Lentinula edodes]